MKLTRHNKVEEEKHKDLDSNLFIFQRKKSNHCCSKENSPSFGLFFFLSSPQFKRKTFQIHTKWYIHCLLFRGCLQIHNLSGHRETLFWNTSQSVSQPDNEITRRFGMWHDWIRLELTNRYHYRTPFFTSWGVGKEESLKKSWSASHLTICTGEATQWDYTAAICNRPQGGRPTEAEPRMLQLLRRCSAHLQFVTPLVTHTCPAPFGWAGNIFECLQTKVI